MMERRPSSANIQSWISQCQSLYVPSSDFPRHLAAATAKGEKWKIQWWLKSRLSCWPLPVSGTVSFFYRDGKFHNVFKWFVAVFVGPKSLSVTHQVTPLVETWLMSPWCVKVTWPQQSTLGCPKKNKSPNFGTQLTPMVFIGWMNHQKKIQHYRPINAIVQAIFSFTL